MLIIRHEHRISFLLVILVAANVTAWVWALTVFYLYPAMMTASLLAWGYGLRHAVDADHLAAIDNVTRKMMQLGKRPLGVGTWFSLGHSSIVFLASIGIAATAAAFQQKMDWFHRIGEDIGTAVSASFLLAMAMVNLFIFLKLWRCAHQQKRGETSAVTMIDFKGGGIMNWLFHSVFRMVNKSWHMYIVGFLFGLGFDTATEIGVLGLSAASAAGGLSLWSILIFPALFTSGMALVDTLDNIIMVKAYGWAFNNPQRKLYYNMTITGTSVIVALLIGGLEALALLVDKLSLQGTVWQGITQLNDHLGSVGVIIMGLLIAFWGISVFSAHHKKIKLE